MASVEFQVLGTVGAVGDDGPVGLGGGRMRTLLAALLLRAGRVVTVDQLRLDVWGEESSLSPRGVIQAGVSRLRRALGDTDATLIRTDPSGYLIDLDGHTTDLQQFRELTAAARKVDQPTHRIELLDRALGLWRGDPLQGATTGTLVDRHASALAEERLAAAELRAAARLHSGAVDAAIADLAALTTSSPLREGAWLLLMRAFVAAGRSGEALAAYDAVRRVLADELGADPGPELRDLHQTILAGATSPVDSWPVRTRLPLTVAGFVGRDDLVRQLRATLADADGTPVVALSGLPGVGKTTLAIRVAHELRSTFTDGQWFVALRGGGGVPRDLAEVCGELLTYCGVPADVIPTGLEARAGLLRQTLTGRRVLLILDDAGADGDVESLLPNSVGAAVLITSRHRLGALAISVGARCRTVDPLALPQARDLLLAAEPGLAEGEALDELVRLCAGLPLALRIAAVTAAGLNLSTYVAHLRDGSRLDRLSLGPGHLGGVRAAFDLSHRALPPAERELFALLGLHPGHEFGAGVAAALTGRSPADAAGSLSRLADASLLIRVDVDRYAFHDLLLEYVCEQVSKYPQAIVARARMLDWYLYSAAAAAGQIYDSGIAGISDPPPTGLVPESVVGVDAALGWFDREWDNLVAAVQWASEHGLDDRCWQLAASLWRYVEARRRWQDHRTLFATAVDAARRTGQVQGLGGLLNDYGNAQLMSGHPDRAIDAFEEAHELARRANDSRREAVATGNLGRVLHLENRHAEAVPYYRECYQLCGKTEQPLGQANAITNLASCLMRLGDLDGAEEAAAEGYEIYRTFEYRRGLAMAAGSRGEIQLERGNYREALVHLTECLDLFRQLGDPSMEAEAQVVIALTQEKVGDLTAARLAAAKFVQFANLSGGPQTTEAFR
ncbi:BTAD domain-containing putative transcriptional regulator, partial [Kribbella sp. NPDC051952]|uniref:AfsR/SARP family transcriptional regulator n=1 Tax=Kribbella sp. NPDC051952 TaxID=3154851 RepID=UPI00341C363B